MLQPYMPEVSRQIQEQLQVKKMCQYLKTIGQCPLIYTQAKHVKGVFFFNFFGGCG